MNHPIQITLKELKSYNSELDIFNDHPFDYTRIKKGLYPPVVVSEQRLIWGFAIVKSVCNEIDNSATGDFVFNALNFVDLNRMDALKAALSMENRAGTFTFYEKEKMMEYLKEPFDAQTSELIEGHVNLSLYEGIKKYSQYHPGLKELINEGIIPLKNADLFNELEQAFLSRFNQNTKTQMFSFSNKRLCLTWLFEIFKRDDLDEIRLIALFDKLIEERDTLAKLKEFRYPQITNLHETLEKIREKTVKGSGIRLLEPDCFEGDSFTIQFTFTKNNLAKKIKTLEKLKDFQDELFGLL